MLKILLIDYQKDTIHKMIRCMPQDLILFTAETVSDGEKCITARKPDIILLEPDMKNSERLMENHCRDFRNSPLILFTHEMEPSSLVKAVKMGVSEYISKKADIPVIMNKILSVYRKKETAAFEYTADEIPEFIAGESKAIQSVKQLICRYAESSHPVFICGESGTGKELAARAIHLLSRRKDHPYNPVNCGAIPAALLECELFGSEKGAFTDAVTKPGLFESSSEGTVFLDEIGEMPAASQVKLLRVLEEKQIRRLGSNFRKPVNVRVISATNRDIHKQVETKEFRQDLFYRLNVLNILIPPLRARMEDLPVLTEHLIRENGINKAFSAPAVEKLFDHSWPGNIRELRNVIIRAAVLCDGETVHAEHIQFI